VYKRLHFIHVFVVAIGKSTDAGAAIPGIKRSEKRSTE
jgi:hypothetical protein